MNQTISVRAIACAAVLVAAAIPSPTSAQQTAASPTACYVPGSGTVYVIKQSDTPASCRPGHVEFSLAAASKPVTDLLAPPGNTNAVPTNSQGAFDLTNDNGVVASGTWGSGNIPASGAGTRLMWYPRMAAFRAGIVGGTQWDASNIGPSSAAFGANTTASGAWSLSGGSGSSATGLASFAMGFQTQATGDYSAGVGYQTHATKYGAIAMGVGTRADGYASVALGHQSKTTDGYSAAIGNWAVAGQNAVAIGMSTASGPGSVAIRGHASGNNSIAIGSTANASGSSAIVIGQNSVADGIASMAVGALAHTNGKYGSFVYGDFSGSGLVKAQTDNHFVVRAKKFWFGTNNAVTATANRFIETSTGAYLSSGGAWVSSSDSTKKHRWEDVDGEAVLSRLAEMPVRSWSYREEGDSVRHLGPTAQDFRTAFGLGDTDRAIATVDADGVSLAGIKALAQRTTDLRRENDELRALVGEVLRRLSAVEAGRR